MKRKGVVAIVGRSNVGKSALFNRIIKEKKAIVEDKIGVTRDRIYGNAEWLTLPFIIIDTGGLVFTDRNQPFSQEIKNQVEIAMDESDLIIFMTSYKEGLTLEDEIITKMLYKTNKPIVLVVNKYDQQNIVNQNFDFLTLGLGDPIYVSAAHGIGIGNLLDEIILKLPKNNEETDNSITNIAIIGKPNVGKSSLVNALLNDERMIVSPVAGTTIDAVDSYIKYNNQQYCLIDTAGIRKKSKLYETIEKYSYLRALTTINKADLVLLVLDISQKISEIDANIGGLAFDQKKPIIIIANKWDLVENKDDLTMNRIEKEVFSHFKYLQYAKIVFLSAKQKERIHTLFKTVALVEDNLQKRIQTSLLNEIINKAQLLNPPSKHNGGVLRIYYANQIKTVTPTFVFFVNEHSYLHFSYKRYLENQIRKEFDFSGVPINFIFRKRK